MSETRKRFIKYGIVIPLIISILMTIAFFPAYSYIVRANVFTEREFNFTNHVSAKVNEAEKQSVKAKNNKIKKADLKLYGDNTIIGNASVNGKKLPVILRANDINSAGRLNIVEKSSLPGETGAVYMFCNKKDGSPVKKLSEGDIISVETYYGVFKYEMRETLVADNNRELTKCADSYGRSLVIYTDESNGYGLSNSYFVAVAELVSDDVVVE